MASTINATTSGIVTIGDSVATLSLQTGGNTAVAIDTAQIVTLSKSLALLGSTSGSVALAAPAVAGTQSYTLPTAAPAVNGYALTSTTAGVMSWASAGSSQWTTSGSNIYYSTGNVGIGISSPTTPLYVQATGQCINTFETTNAANDAGLTMKNGTRSWNLFNNGGDGRLRFYDNTAAADRMTIDSSGRVLVGLTSANTSGSNFQVSQGVTFPATQSASTDVNTLDDYEEGTWTPTCSNGSTYTGVYTKIGRIVHLFYNSTSSGTITAGSTTLTGIPFSPSGTIGSGTYVNATSTTAFGGTQLSGTTLYFATASTGPNISGYHCYYV
jgi:hypothetical protein